MMTDTQIAKTIMDQLGGRGRLVAMVDAKNFLYDSNSLSFRFSGLDRINYVKIELADDDTYMATFGRMVKWYLRSQSTVGGIYADGLVELFENTTGLRLSLCNEGVEQ